MQPNHDFFPFISVNSALLLIAIIAIIASESYPAFLCAALGSS